MSEAKEPKHMPEKSLPAHWAWYDESASDCFGFKDYQKCMLDTATFDALPGGIEHLHGWVIGGDRIKLYDTEKDALAALAIVRRQSK